VLTVASGGLGVEKLFAVGDAIEARYIKPREGDVFAAVSVTQRVGQERGG
jgi:hypothetical protein